MLTSTMARCVFALLNVLALSAADSNDYCKINSKCNDSGTHTMCSFPDETPGAGCGGTLDEAKLLSAREKELILNLHNELRGRLTDGRVERQPPAARLSVLEWDQELETMARRWAMQCNSTSQKCRFTKKGEAFGENLSTVRGVKFSGNVDAQIQAWFDEHMDFPSEVVNSYHATRSRTEHYTQIVWAATERVGCERAVYNAAGIVEHLVCLYHPAGNVVGQQVYPTVEQEQRAGTSDKIIHIGFRGSKDKPAAKQEVEDTDNRTDELEHEDSTDDKLEHEVPTVEKVDNEVSTDDTLVTEEPGKGGLFGNVSTKSGNGSKPVEGVMSAKGSLSEEGQDVVQENAGGAKPGGRDNGYFPGRYINKGGRRGAVGQLQPTWLPTAVGCLLVVKQLYDCVLPTC